MNARVEKLFSPLKLGAKTAPNRIVFAAHLTNFGFDNVFTARHAAYYAARARGGAGLIISEAMSVHPSDWPYPRAIFGHKATCVEGLRQVREAVKAANPQTLLLAQLNHTGGQGTEDIVQREILAPSAVQDIITRQVPKAMEIEDIKAVIAGFGQAAGYVRQAGLDGVEINIAERSLIRQFLSGLTNYRGDEYGGSPENKLRFAIEVIDAVRTAVGQDLVVGIKLCGDELAPWAGLTPEQARAVGKALAETGKLDYISVMMGSIYSLDKAQASMHTPPGYAAHLAAGMRETLRAAAIDLPVFASGRIHDPVLANNLLNEESADFIEMTRALISDAELPAKAQSGQLADIRHCTACNQDCQVRSTMNPLLSCVHNPSAGEEATLSDSLIGRALISRKVLIIGAGPAGMEAARVAALRGHKVALYEKGDKLGGAINLAKAGPGRDAWQATINYFENQLKQLGVEVRFNNSVTPEFVQTERPDVVIVATGGRSVPLHNMPIAAGMPVLWARDIMAAVAAETIGQPPATTQKVALIDEVGGFAAVSTAEVLVKRGHKVTFISHDPFPSRDLPQTLDLNGWYSRALVMGIEFMAQKYLRAVEAGALVLEDIYSHAEERLTGIDTVVLANYEYPNDELYQRLKALSGRTFELHRAGDCVAARKIGHAVREGNRIARSL